MDVYRGKTVWVTGASSGIGEALVHALARQGARVILSARRLDALERVRAAAGLNETQGVCVPLDLGQPEGLTEVVRQVLDHVGRIDILINNGGISQRSRALETDLSVVRQLLTTNFLGTVALTQALLPHWLARGQGQVVVVSSLVGKFGTPLRSAYSASKHALHGYFDSLRAELPVGVGVTLVCPGFIRTHVSVNALVADGSAQGTMDRAQAEGMPAEVCAEKLLRAVARRRNEVYIGGREVLGVQLKRFFPAIFARIVRRARVT